jgi:hypothetical protein
MRPARGIIAFAGFLFLVMVMTPALGAAKPTAAQRARDAEHQRIMEYWTPARRAAAQPRDIVLPLGTRPHAGKPGGGSTGVTGATWTGGGAVSKTAGKVYFTADGSNWVCSGSVVDSGHNNLVMSAGHCVNDGDGGPFATNWAFYPGYQTGDRTDAAKGWTATDLFTTTDWATHYQAFANDIGMAVVYRPGGVSLETAVAATIPTVAFTTDYSGTYYSFGYPAAKKYNGQILTYCANPVARGYDGDNGALSMVCGMTGGSSGGPWYRAFNASTGTGTIHSLNSYGYGGGYYRDRMFGPVLGSQEQAVYNRANTTPDCAPTTGVACSDLSDPS